MLLDAGAIPKFEFEQVRRLGIAADSRGAARTCEDHNTLAFACKESDYGQEKAIALSTAVTNGSAGACEALLDGGADGRLMPAHDWRSLRWNGCTAALT